MVLAVLLWFAKTAIVAAAALFLIVIFGFAAYGLGCLTFMALDDADYEWRPSKAFPLVGVPLAFIFLAASIVTLVVLAGWIVQRIYILAKLTGAVP